MVSLALSWVGAILFAVFVFALCAVGWPKVVFGRPAVAQIWQRSEVAVERCCSLRVTCAAPEARGRRVFVTLLLLLVSYRR